MSSIRKKITPPCLFKLKKAGQKIVVLTSADFLTAKILDEAGVEVILVGDSLGTTILGYESTVSVTMREMLHHCRAVTRAKPNALVVGDMPFGSYHQSVDQAVRNAVRFIREAGCDAVKLEGGVERADKIKAIVEAGIPVMGHIGLLPQSVLREGGYRVRGKTSEDIQVLKKDLAAVEKAGAFSCVFEYIQADAAQRLTRQAKIPTIGIGSGLGCDGQVLVTSDLLGLPSGLTPKAVRKYAELGKEMKQAFEKYATDVRKGKFPGKSESF